jgi:hypothetical protein
VKCVDRPSWGIAFTSQRAAWRRAYDREPVSCLVPELLLDAALD